MDNKGLISVIIPVYNVEKYLRECIDSVLHQTYQNFEILLVDDGSTDTSGEICGEYVLKHPNIFIIYKNNGGASSARNAGVQEAKGQYLYFLDSDDKLVPYAFEHLMKCADREDSDILFFEAYSFKDDSQQMEEGNYSYQKNYGNNKGVVVLEQLIRNKEFHVSIPLLFIKRDFFVNAKMKLIEGIMYEDMVFTYDLFCKADKVSHVPEKLYQRRYREGSVMQTKKRKYNYDSAVVVYKHMSRNKGKYELLDIVAENQYIARWAFNILNIHRQLDRIEKKACVEKHRELKGDILRHNAYGNRALKMRCYGVIPWFCYKIVEKLFNVKGR